MTSALSSQIPSPAAPRTSHAAWFESWFDSPHYHQLYGHRDEREAADFVDALVGRLHPAAHARALDLGCGAGRHARQLAARGLRVTGIDLSANSIQEARRSAGPHLHFRRQDMRVAFGRSQFDFVFNLFTSFGYFDTVADHLRVVSNMARALKPGGRLVLDYLNAHPAEARLVSDEVRTIDDVVYRVTRWTDASHFYKRIRIEDAHRRGEVLEHLERVAKFSLDDFRRMFRRYGLRIEAVYGDYALGAYDPKVSPRLIVQARKATGDRQQATGWEAGRREATPGLRPQAPGQFVICHAAVWRGRGSASRA